MTFGQRLRELRKAKSMTQRELAEKTGISFAYVSKLETGVMPPPREKIILTLAKVLDVNDADMDELFGLAKKMPSDLREQIDTEMIRRLRSFEDEKDTRIHAIATSEQWINELQASEIQRTWPEEIPGERDEPFRALFENSLDGIVVLDSNLDVIYESPSASRIVGYKQGEFAGKDTLSIIHPDDMSKIAHRLTKLVQNTGDTSYTQLRVRHKDGTHRIIDVVANNLTHNPAVKGVVISYRDITGRSKAEGAWAEQAALAIAKEYLLTDKEQRVLILLAEGQSNVRIAEQLMVSPSTVRFHVSSIFSKLGVTSRTEAVAMALRRHIIT
jgi:PAS domain S-box-containing protein